MLLEGEWAPHFYTLAASYISARVESLQIALRLAPGTGCRSLCPVGYTLGQAAKASGISKPTIARAIKRGALSAVKRPDGTYDIQPAELHRVWPAVTGASGPPAGDMVARETTGMERERDLLREMLERERQISRDLLAERDRLLGLLEAQTPRLIEYQPWWRRWRR